MVNILKKITSGFDAVFHPACCDLCGRYHEFPIYWICESCWQRTSHTLRPMTIEISVDGEKPFTVYGCWQFHDEIQQVIHCLKYRRHNSIAPVIGRTLQHRLFITSPLSKFEYLVPVPLHKKRKAWRGFNQSELIARGLAAAQENLQIADALERHRITGPQAALNREDRLKNVQDAFMVKAAYRGQLLERSVLLIDDVVTSGATAAACISALQHCEPAAIAVVSVAYVGENYLPESVIV